MGDCPLRSPAPAPPGFPLPHFAKITFLAEHLQDPSQSSVSEPENFLFPTSDSFTERLLYLFSAEENVFFGPSVGFRGLVKNHNPHSLAITAYLHFF